MSDLDDAIREHFALMRSHGADPGEVARLEQEALGEVSPDTTYAPAYERTSLELVVEDYPPQEEEVQVLHEELAASTNEHARTRVRSNLDGAEATQEFRVEEIGWNGGPAWQGGAA
jgi:hypothetical protein